MCSEKLPCDCVGNDGVLLRGLGKMRAICSSDNENGLMSKLMTCVASL